MNVKIPKVTEVWKKLCGESVEKKCRRALFQVHCCFEIYL